MCGSHCSHDNLTAGQISLIVENIYRAQETRNIDLDTLVIMVLKELRVGILNYDSYERQVRHHIIQMNPALVRGGNSNGGSL